jgi:hypothetical protein
MFELTFDDSGFLDFCENNYVYKGSQYVFTFDERFWVYYYKRGDKYIYIALDSKTGLGSEFASTSFKYKKNELDTLVPNLLNSIKYTGELKYLSAANLEIYKKANVSENM